MKLMPRIFWEKPGEKKRLQEIIEESSSTISCISNVAREFNISLSDAQIFVQVYKTVIKK